ncbi:replication-associated recombination protein A [Leucothrix mucor]|uniref:replication-associated recombination protein A n=1 Tax=Leucothrix mucor TaxID=45248 RepID=UPI0003B62E35|nr:replication-associated recombination protein A [Leucothrix mucor]
MSNAFQPLADRMRPERLEDYAGQSHLLAAGKPLRAAIDQDHLHSMLFWGPPGTGKTTLARLIANYSGAAFQTLSAVLSGVKDIRLAVDKARQHYADTQRASVLFVDEVHRFNKSQQDAFLPHIENGTFIFIGATTENPSFELNNALLSRLRTYVLRALTPDDIRQVLSRAINDEVVGFGKLGLQVPEKVVDNISVAADGDARRALNWLEIAVDLAEPNPDDDGVIISESVIAELATERHNRFDNKGDVFYEQISALHKSVRGSNPDGALYWFCRMLDGGCDPHYVARRIVRMASEEVGNADPRALSLALDAWQTFDRLGSPEGELALAQAVLYLAVAPKSNAAYMAYNHAKDDAAKSGSLEVPMHLRNAPTRLMKQMGFNEGYRYAHNEDDAYAAGETYLPDALQDRVYYQPVARGLEIKIGDKLKALREKDKIARKKSS